MPATATESNTLTGQTIRWKFEDSPTAGGSYEHTFNEDGSVSFSMLKGEKAGQKKGTPTRVDKYASFAVAPEVQMVSYLSPESGFTLTVAMNFETKKIYGFASNEKEWHPVAGTMEIVK